MSRIVTSVANQFEVTFCAKIKFFFEDTRFRSFFLLSTATENLPREMFVEIIATLFLVLASFCCVKCLLSSDSKKKDDEAKNHGIEYVLPDQIYIN